MDSVNIYRNTRKINELRKNLQMPDESCTRVVPMVNNPAPEGQ